MVKKRLAEEPEKIEIDFGIGKLSLSGIIKGLGGFVDLVERMEREGKSEVRREGEIRGLGPKARGIYGFTVRTGLGNKPVMETFGNIRETKMGPKVQEVQAVREPIVDVFDEEDHLLVVAELPGVRKSEVEIVVSGDILILRAEVGEQKYFKEILLPHKVSSATKKVSYKNGILEIRFRKPKAKGDETSPPGGEAGTKSRKW